MRSTLRRQENDVVSGIAVGRTLRLARSRIAVPGRFCSTAWASDMRGVALHDLEEVHRARRLSLLGALDAVTASVALQEAACRALRHVADAAGVESSLARFGERHGHERTLQLLDDAIALAPRRTWDAARALALPSRPPTGAELDEIGFRHQAIDEVFFGSERSMAMQYEMTRGVAQARRAEQGAFNAYLAEHREAVAALLRRRDRSLRTRASRLTWRLRSACSRGRGDGEDVAF